VTAQLPGTAYDEASRAETGALTVHFSFTFRNERNRTSGAICWMMSNSSRLDVTEPRRDLLGEYGTVLYLHLNQR
jgi:hypothetical protein